MALGYARSFNGTSDVINLTLGTLGNAFTDTTFAAIVKPAVSAVVDGPIISLQNSAHFYINNSTGQQDFYDYSTFNSWGSGNAETMNQWQLVAYTKPTGSSSSRVHTYDYVSGLWDHFAGAGSLPNLTTPGGAVRIGSSQFGGFYSGLIACIGVWRGTALSDVVLESLTRGIAAWTRAAPTGLWLLNQPTTSVSVQDRAGTSHQSSISGTTVSAVSDLLFEGDDMSRRIQSINWLSRAAG